MYNLFISCFIITYLMQGLCFGDNSKRFLVNNNNNMYCVPISWFCHLKCANGYKMAANNCPTCQCATNTGATNAGTAVAKNHQTNYGTSSYYHSPCNPTQMFCPLRCAHGYQRGNGCIKCECATAQIVTQTTTKEKTTRVVQTTTVAHTTTKQTTLAKIITPAQSVLGSATASSGSGPPSPSIKNPCLPSHANCSKSCQYGYLKGPSFCEYCYCAPQNANQNMAVPTTAKPAVPCISGQKPCNATCKNGYVKGPSDCFYCLCAPDSLVTTAATGKPLTNHDGNISSTPSTSNKPSASPLDVSSECLVATTICQLKCKDGFIIDQNHCTQCICKDEVYKAVGIPQNDLPSIKIMEPCVKGLDICRIFCAKGYLRGPQKCQFCACLN